MQTYYYDDRGNAYEFEADTAGGIYGWFRNLETGESVRLRRKALWELTDKQMLALAKAAV